MNEKYSLPHHEYCYLATPFLAGDRGGRINQRINYEELLPTCAGKLHKLEWSHLTEEDRYTKRNYVIREGFFSIYLTVIHKNYYLAQRRNDETADISGMSENSEGHSWGGARGYYAKIFVVAFMVTIYSGLPGTNSRSMNSVDPMYQSETCKVVNSSCETHYKIEFRTNPGLHLFQFSDLLLLI